MIDKTKSATLMRGPNTKLDKPKISRRPPEAQLDKPPSGRVSDIFGLILDLEPGFSKAHRRIAQALLSQPQVFVETPIEDLAPWIGVSAPTVTRFSHVVRCEGLRELKLRIMGSMRVGLRYLELATPPVSVADAVSRAS